MFLGKKFSIGGMVEFGLVDRFVTAAVERKSAPHYCLSCVTECSIGLLILSAGDSLVPTINEELQKLCVNLVERTLSMAREPCSGKRKITHL